MTKPIILLLYLSSFSSLFSQDFKFQSLIIDHKFKKNANSLIEDEKTLIEIESEKNMIVDYTKVITIFNEYGVNDIDAFVHYDKNVNVYDLEAIIYDMAGNRIEKIKKRDFKDVSAVSGGTLYSDSRVYYLDYKPQSYPYTVEFKYRLKNKNTAFIPPWNPIGNYHQGVKRSEYIIKDKSGLEIRHLEKNLDDFGEINSDKTANELKYVAKDIVALKHEEYSPSLSSFTPIVHFSLSNFYLEGVEGSGSNWKEFGKWQYEKLIKDRDVVSKETETDILELTEGIENPLEKIKLIYDYIQNKTRYISVQVGIGGWQPIAASEVDKVKYGDCKGLTNYTKALLKIAGIESNYTVVFAGSEKRDLEKDFASMQGNHVILNVPIENQNVWLECTSQDAPFGFLGTFTDDRDVLVISEQGGEIKRTDAYLAEDNSQKLNADITIESNGDMTAKFNIISTGTQFSNKFQLEKKPMSEIKKFYKSYYRHLKNLELESFSFNLNKNDVQFEEILALKSEKYANKFGNRLMLNVNALNQTIGIPDNYDKRQTPFTVDRGFFDEDIVNFQFPNGFALEDVPDNIEITTKFGKYSATFSVNESGIFKYKRSILVKNAEYSKEDYADFREFFIDINKADQQKIILINKT